MWPSKATQQPQCVVKRELQIPNILDAKLQHFVPIEEYFMKSVMKAFVSCRPRILPFHEKMMVLKANMQLFVMLGNSGFVAVLLRFHLYHLVSLLCSHQGKKLSHHSLCYQHHIMGIN